MRSISFRTRLGLAASATVLIGGLGVTGPATASPAESGPSEAVPLGLTLDDEYWACLALDYVEVGTCLENPLPDLSGLPSIPQTIDDLLRGIGASQPAP